MILLAGSLDLASSPSVLTDASRRTPDREREPRNQAWTPPGASCLRCGGLLVPSYTASLEPDVTGTPVTLRRCVNCGNCVDRDILANRGKGPVPACESADRSSTHWTARIEWDQAWLSEWFLNVLIREVGNRESTPLSGSALVNHLGRR